MEQFTTSTPELPMDMIYEIRDRMTDPASLARLASSCWMWRNLITNDHLFLANLRHRLCVGFIPSLLLGFFFQDKHVVWHHQDKDKHRCLGEPPRFMPISRDLDASVSMETFFPGLGEILNLHRPVACQGSLIAFRRAATRSLDDRVCVCNPLTGDVQFVNSANPHWATTHYVLFATDADSYQLFAVSINKTEFTELSWKSMSSVPGSAWQWSETILELRAGLRFLSYTPMTTSNGLIRWLACNDETSSNAIIRCLACTDETTPTNTATHVVTLRVHDVVDQLSYIEIPDEAKTRRTPLLATSAREELLLLHENNLQISLWRHDGTCWLLSQSIDMRSYSSLPQSMAKIKLECFAGKSGMVVMRIKTRTKREGRFLLSLSDGSIRKIADEAMAERYMLCPYEIDWLSCLAIANLVVDGSLDADEGRTRAKERWNKILINISKELADNKEHA